MNAEPLPMQDLTKGPFVSASVNDGFNGARDASILERYADFDDRSELPAIKWVRVQAVTATRATLRRAGVSRCRTHDFYQVAVYWCPKYSRLQLA